MPLTVAYEELVRAQKPAKGVSLYSRFVNRPLGRAFAACGAAIGLTPDQVTVLSALSTTAAVLTIAIAPPSIVSGVVIAALIVLGFALDAADGQLARLTRTGSSAGEWFDHVIDAGKVVALHSAVLIAAYRFFDLDLYLLLVPMAYQLVGAVVQAGGTLRERLGRGIIPSSKTNGSASRFSAIGLLAADSGVFGLLFLTWAWPEVFTVLYGLLFLANAAIGVMLLVKWKRELSAMKEGSAE